MHRETFFKNITRFIYELGMLKRHKHDGYALAGVENLPSIAEHSLRAAQIAYILAFLEGYERPEEVVTMVVFHDIEETRIPDINKVANRYVTIDKDSLFKEQLEERLGELGRRIRELREKVNYRYENNRASLIAKDADYLEQAFTAKELYERGYKDAWDWINNVEKALRTESARMLLEVMKNTSSTEWWHGLKKIDMFRKETNK